MNEFQKPLLEQGDIGGNRRGTENIRNGWDMNRLEALKAAREYVAELYAIKNDRGYPRFSGSVTDVLSQELRIAEFLLLGCDPDV